MIDVNSEPKTLSDAKVLIDMLRAELRRRPQVVVIREERDVNLRFINSRFRDFVHPKDVFGIEVITDDGRQYRFKSAVCVETPAEIVDHEVKRFADGKCHILTKQVSRK